MDGHIAGGITGSEHDRLGNSGGGGWLIPGLGKGRMLLGVNGRDGRA